MTGAGMMLVWATGYPGVDPQELERAIVDEMEGLATASEEEVARAVALAETGVLGELETVSQRADLLSMFTTHFGDPGRLKHGARSAAGGHTSRRACVRRGASLTRKQSDPHVRSPESTVTGAGLEPLQASRFGTGTLLQLPCCPFLGARRGSGDPRGCPGPAPSRHGHAADGRRRVDDTRRKRRPRAVDGQRAARGHTTSFRYRARGGPGRNRHATRSGHRMGLYDGFAHMYRRPSTGGGPVAG